MTNGLDPVISQCKVLMDVDISLTMPPHPAAVFSNHGKVDLQGHSNNEANGGGVLKCGGKQDTIALPASSLSRVMLTEDRALLLPLPSLALP